MDTKERVKTTSTRKHRAFAIVANGFFVALILLYIGNLCLSAVAFWKTEEIRKQLEDSYKTSETK